VRPFPFDAVRDLIGLLRAIYAAEKRRAFPSQSRLLAVQRAAKALHDATAMAAVHDPGTAPYRRAVGIAESVTAKLADLIELTTPMEPVLLIAGARVRRRPATKWRENRLVGFYGRKGRG
jgi:hypothetical protein